MANNDSVPSIRKRGRPANKLSVRLFLLDPDNRITKVTKETCSKNGINALKGKGCGPPKQEHCVSEDSEKVEFPFELTNEQFKQKLVEIYPKLENSFFMFMKADKNNLLVELNPGICCFRCYTPENVYHSERGQGRLYIRVITENEIHFCNHGIKRWRSTVGGGNFVRILPKPVPTGSSSVGAATDSVAIPTNLQLATANGAESYTSALDLSSFSIVVAPNQSLVQAQDSSNVVGQRAINFSTVSSANFGNITSTAISQTATPPLPHSSGNLITPSNLTLSVIAAPKASSRPADGISNNISSQSQVSVIISRTSPTSAIDSSGHSMMQNMLATKSPGHPSSMLRQSMLESSGSLPVARGNSNRNRTSIGSSANYTATSGWQNHYTVVNNQSPAVVTSDTCRTGSSQGLEVLALVSEAEREQHKDSAPSGSRAQGNLDSPAPEELAVDEFLENVEATKNLDVSLSLLKNDALLKKLHESDITFHTVNIQPACKILHVLRNYPFPSCLKVLRILENNLNLEDITHLVRSLSGVNGLQDLHLCGTKFQESSAFAFICVLNKCKDLTTLNLTDNGFTKQEINGLTTAFENMKNLTKLNLSKSNLSGKQTNEILKKLAKTKNLDLSRNVLQGNEIVTGISQLESLEELDLSHNSVKFSPLPDLSEGCLTLSTNTKVISLSSNNMIPDDISLLCSLIRSSLLKLNLDSNHIGPSIWSLCSLGSRIKNLKVLSLANTNVCLAVDGLAFLFSLVGELEELDLSSNNLMVEDFVKIQSPLSKLTLMKRLNFSRNVIRSDAITVILDILKELILLQSLDISESCIEGNDVSVLCNGLFPLKNLKYLNISGSRIDVEDSDDDLYLPSTLEELLLSDIENGEKLFRNWKGSLQSLRRLRLSNMKLRACDVEMLSAVLLSVPQLEELCLPGADIVVPDGDCEKLLGSIKTLSNIKKIDLSSIKLAHDRALADLLTCKSLLFLEELVLTDMKIEQMDGERLFSAIKLLKHLRKLNLGGVRVHNVKAMFDMLSYLPILEELVFPLVIMSGDCINGYLNAPESLSCLKSLDLRGIKSLKPLAEALTRVLRSMQLLEKLALGKICCDDESEKRVFDAIGKLKYLKEFHVDDCFVDEANEAVLAEPLSSLQVLEKLGLDVVKSGDFKFGKRLFGVIGNLRYLKELLCHFVIDEAGVDALTHALPSLQMLENLQLRSVVVDKCNELFSALGKLRYLKKLELDVTYWAANCEAVIEMLRSLRLLEELVLSYDVFGGSGNTDSRKQLLSAIGELTYLKTFHFIYPKTSVIDVEALQENVGKLKMLKDLRIDYN